MNIIKHLLKENENKANRFASVLLFFLSIGIYIVWILNAYGTQLVSNKFTFIVYSIIAIFCLLCSFYTVYKKYEGENLKYLYIIVSITASSLLCMSNVYNSWYYFVIPVVICIRYYDTKLVLFISVVSIVSLIISQIVGLGFGYLGDCLDVNAIVSIPDNTTITITGGLTRTLIMKGYINPSNINSYAIGMFGTEIFVMIFISVLSYYIAKHGYELLQEIAIESEKSMKADMNVAISQIRPHFLYNSLTAIMAIDDNPPETVEAIGNFGKYLRNNLNTLSNSDLISFDKEISHVENYIYLERLRFKDKLNVEYDIQCRCFELPALSIQMLVENGIKHGISKKREGGTIIVSSYEDADNYVVEVKDDGIGFNCEEVFQDENNHVGIASCRYRLNQINAKLEINSKIDIGTSCKILIPKQHEDNSSR